MSSKTMESFRNSVLAELSEAANSALAALPSGMGTNGFAVDPEPGMLALLNEAKDALVKRALPVSCVGTKAVMAGDGPRFSLSSFNVADTKSMRVAETTSFTPNGGTRGLLTRMSPDALNAFYYDRETAASAVPKYWAYAKNDTRSIELHRRVNSNGTLTVSGYGIPADATGDSSTFPWLNADDERAIILYAAVMLTQRASDDPRLGAMRAFLAPQLDAMMLAIRNRISPVVQTSYLEVYVPFSGAGGAA